MAPEPLVEAVHELAASVKPRLRGWLHAGAFPLSVVAGLVLIATVPSSTARIATAVYAGTASLLFGVSALYHRFSWGPRADGALKRLDHANIFLIIAGTYTPFTVLLLGRSGSLLLWIVWIGAVLGVAFRVLWVGAPRWLYVPVYGALGWVAVLWLPAFARAGGVAVLLLILAGGLLYTAGALVYALRRPDPSPRWFGFHEVFHSFTLGGWSLHFIAVCLAAYQYA